MRSSVLCSQGCSAGSGSALGVASGHLASFSLPPAATPAAPAATVKLNIDAQLVAADNAVSGGVLPDLRKSPFVQTADAFKRVVHGGALSAKGMFGFARWLSAVGLEEVPQCRLKRAQDSATR